MCIYVCVSIYVFTHLTETNWLVIEGKQQTANAPSEAHHAACKLHLCASTSWPKNGTDFKKMQTELVLKT